MVINLFLHRLQFYICPLFYNIVQRFLSTFYISAFLFSGIIFLISAYHFYGFNVEDAYIAYRYAEKFVQTGALVFNDGEQINALTSPLHGLILSCIYYITSETLIFNKFFSFILLLAGFFLIWSEFKGRRDLRLAAVILILLCPQILIWTFGGLETIYLQFFVTLAVLQVVRYQREKTRNLTLIFILIGICFLLRYDSSVFFFPIIIWLFFHSEKKRFFKGSVIGSVIPLSWLLVSYLYYGDIFPTSFYHKMPGIAREEFQVNYIYIRNYLVVLLVIPFALIVLLQLFLTKNNLKAFWLHFFQRCWLYFSIALFIIYGFTMATTHMMFSIRFLVPYIPVIIFLLLDLYRGAGETNFLSKSASKVSIIIHTSFITSCLFAQCYLIHYTYCHSINGMNAYGEYRKLNIDKYQDFMNILATQAMEAKIHWKEQSGKMRKTPRIHTYAGGLVSYLNMDAYIYDALVSYRHKYSEKDFFTWRGCADYVLIATPIQGKVEQQLGELRHNCILLSSYKLSFNGRETFFQLYHNPAPAPHPLKPKVNH